MAELKTTYKDDVLNTSKNTKRKFNMITNSDGTVSFEDVTEYSQVGDAFSATDVNAITEEVNALNTNIDERIAMGTEITSLTTPYTNGIKAILQLRNDGYLTVLKTIDNGVTWGVVKDLTADTRFLRQDPVDEDIIELAENLNSQVFRSYFYYGYTGTGTPCNNAPTDSHGFMLVNKTSSDNIHITAFPTFGHGRFFTKAKVNGTWQEWMEHGTENRKQHKLLFKYFSTMTATATELDCNWKEYDYLIVYMCHYANVMAHTIVPYDYFKSTTSGTRPIIEYGDCSLQVWQNGFGSIIVKPNQNCIDAANYAIMIYGVSA